MKLKVNINMILFLNASTRSSIYWTLLSNYSRFKFRHYSLGTLISLKTEQYLEEFKIPKIFAQDGVIVI